jgi:type III secretion protein J
VVTVGSGTRVRAWQVLEASGLPRRKTNGFERHYPTGGMIPTASEERILEQYATAEELKAGLLKVDGVVDAHVNLVMPETPEIQLRGRAVEPPRASVLVKYRADIDASPVTADQVRQMVAGGVERLAPSAVRVMQTPATRVTGVSAEPAFASVGPIAVSPSSKLTLQAVVGGFGILIVLLGGGVGWLTWREMQRHARGEEI